MKLSYNWLKEYLHCNLSVHDIASIMTSIGIEVNGITEEEEIEGGLKSVCVAEVLTCIDHPDSDHLHITTVNDGSEDAPLTVVCGAANVAVGKKVMLAKIGAVLPGDFKIKKSKIRGVESFGMLCAEDELGIGQGHEGIMILPEDTKVGTTARDYFSLQTQSVIEYEITANRVDAASHIGVARDIYAYLKLNDIDAELSYPTLYDLNTSSGENEPIKIHIEDKDACPRYVGVYMKNVKVGPSPEFIKKRLSSIGLKPINNIVDISNYVLFELGQPLHIFDADRIIGGEVIIRKANEGESLKTLDEVKRKLSTEDIIIADKYGPLCIAGIFGGKESGVSNETENIFIESAYFNPVDIRRTSKFHSLQTDSSFRFERGANPDMTAIAAKRTVQLILECCPEARIVGAMQDNYPQLISNPQIELDYDYIQNFIGKQIGRETIDKILDGLAYKFISRDEHKAVVVAPVYMIDVKRQCDVIEEILRIYGYNNIEIPQTMRSSISPSTKPEPESLKNYVSNFMVANGFCEIMNNSLTKLAYYEGLTSMPKQNCVKIVNPLSNDLNVMRQSLIFGGLEVLAYNINRQVNNIRVFEFGSVYKAESEENTDSLSNYKEHPAFLVMMSGDREKTWRCEAQKASFFQLKSYVELLMYRYGFNLYDCDTEEAPSDIFATGLRYKLRSSSKVLLDMGRINPNLARRFGIKQEVFCAEINWDTFFEIVSRVRVKFSELPRFPEVRRDLAIIIDESVNFVDLRNSAYRVSKKLLTNVSLVDVYRGDKIASGKKQYALSFTFRSLEKTLTDTEIEKLMSKLLATFTNEFGAGIR